MIGFALSNVQHLNNYKQNRQGLVFSQMTVNGLNVIRNTLDKFENDKLFYQNSDYAIVTDGVLLNKTSLFKQMTPGSFVQFLEGGGKKY